MTHRDVIVITGHTGLVGRHLWPKLLAEGSSLVLVNSKGAFRCEPGGSPEPAADLFDSSAMLGLIDGARAVVHLGAPHSAAVASDAPGAVLRNALVTDYFAGLAAKAGVPSFIYASAAAVYYQFTDPQLVVADEDTPLSPDDLMISEVIERLEKIRQSHDYAETYFSSASAFAPEARINSISPRPGYALGKLIGEIIVKQRFQGQRYVSLRITNVAAADDRVERIIPKFITLIKNGGPAAVFDWTRNFIWIEDLIHIIRQTLQGTGPEQGVVNAFAPGNTVHLWDLVQMIGKLTGRRVDGFTLDTDKYEPHIEFTTKHPEVLPAQPAGVQEIIARIIARKPA